MLTAKLSVWIYHLIMIIQSETVMDENMNVKFDINHKTSVSFYANNYNTNNINELSLT